MMLKSKDFRKDLMLLKPRARILLKSLARKTLILLTALLRLLLKRLEQSPRSTKPKLIRRPRMMPPERHFRIRFTRSKLRQI